MAPPEWLLVFARYPQPGTAKTRLIPALGAQGAAAVHARLTESTLAVARALQRDRGAAVTVCYAGATPAQMQAWLGAQVAYEAQSAGDLGERLRVAFNRAFARGAQRAVAIGTDCPELGSGALAAAFERLRRQDVVLGPAADGGYYLIGLSGLAPELFAGIDWGTARVWQQTAATADRLGLARSQLAVRYDIDRPADLARSVRL
jgi:rSAM/selenodomain-associated transferase 1